MTIFDQVNNGIKEAMKAHDKGRLEALRGIKAEFLLIKTAPGNNGEVSDENALKVLVRMAKQRKESAQIYIDQQRQDLADVELLPTSMKDMGKVMGIATKQLAGRAEGRAISAKVKELLAAN